jgi:hypothetical protein
VTVRPRPHHEDRGAALILAIGFVVMIGAISGGLAALATSGLNNRNSLAVVRNREYAADGAIEKAIALVRPLSCTPASGSVVDSTVNGVAIRVDWINACGVVQGGDRGTTASASALDGAVVLQRNVIFSACVDPAPSTTCDPAKVIIRAQVNFEQALVGAVTSTYVQSWSVNR